ncbi:hypothetical protein XELAEV_18031147mg [Xenopus laevis]|uniref:Uncharacterized protein n=1 Tax=Xenopus laevis TaxID=8355 RepID=A0A974HFS6_XENLA|nr:hypothetical protein XELAEV_18031147mg [Xenopus laevis]
MKYFMYIYLAGSIYDLQIVFSSFFCSSGWVNDLSYWLQALYSKQYANVLLFSLNKTREAARIYSAEDCTWRGLTATSLVICPD